jgi:cell division protein FtsI (penicillin-binding protein 3)
MVLGRSVRRVTVGIAVVALLLTVVLVRLVWIQALGGNNYATDASNAQDREVTLHAARGSIVDRNGVALAYTADAKDIVADPTMVSAALKQPYADAIAPLINQPVQQVLTQLSGTTHYALLATAVSPAVADQISNLSFNGKAIVGIFPEATEQRLYPDGTTGSNIVGLVHSDGTGGAAGIEYSYNSLLKGTDGSMSYEIDANGNVNPSGTIKRHNAVNGGTVKLTIDSDLQYVAQTDLDKAVSSSHARDGQVVVENVKTGQVLAMASTGAFDPANPATIDASKSLDPNIQQVFEPGSVNKIVTMTAAIAGHLITPTSTVSVPDQIEMGGVEIHDAWWHPTQNFTTTGVLAESSNVGTLEIASKVGPTVFDQYLQKFGVGQATGIELPGESAGLLPPLSTWSASTFANLPIGQGEAVTSLQLASMYQTIANNGVRIPPRIVESVTSGSGVVTPTTQPAGITVTSPQTAQTVKTMLESVTMTGGTGVKAAIPGYVVAGKTGTAQQIDPATGQYSNSVYWDTFAGMAPADNPKFVIAIMIDNPAPGLEGGDVAAPLFHNIASYELSAAKIAPSGASAKLVPLTVG